jgi:hypothetical protein
VIAVLLGALIMNEHVTPLKIFSLVIILGGVLLVAFRNINFTPIKNQNMNTSIKHYVTSFENLYDGEPWYGKSIMSIVKEVSPSRAYKKSLMVNILFTNSSTHDSVERIVCKSIEWRYHFQHPGNSSLDWVDCQLHKQRKTGIDG